MKSIVLITLTGLLCCFNLNAQIIVHGISPNPIANSYGFTWGDPSGGDWATPDFNVPGTFVQDTLALADDGTPGVSPYGHNLANEACAPLINSVAGKIAVLYRGSCEFSQKALNAQNAGAVAVLMINRENSVIGLGGGTQGLNVTIPVVMISSIDGAALLAEMQNGSVVVFMGNQLGASSNDIGAIEDEVLISSYGGGLVDTYDGFELGLNVHNYGTNTQSNITVNAQITGPSGVMYDQTIGPLSLATGASESLLPGSTNSFPPFDMGIGNYPVGEYTLTYTLNIGVQDEFPVDNVYTYDFSIGNKSLSYARVNANGEPLSNAYPSNAVAEYESCIMVQDGNFNGREVPGIYFVPHADTTQVNPVGSEIFANLYQWDDGWVDLNDPNYTFDPNINDAFQNLNLITFGVHFINSPNEIDQPIYVPFQNPGILQNNERYLFCIQTFDPFTISFGYDEDLNYQGNISNEAQPVSPVYIDGNWFVTGWNGFSAPSLALDLDTTCVNTNVSPLYVVDICPGQSTGEIAIQTTGFNSPVVTWDNNDTGDTITGLTIGTYTASIIDASGCTATITLSVDTLELVPVSQTQDESCAGTMDGSINISAVTNATLPVSYSWNTGATTASINSLNGGNYTVTITDNLGCQTTENFAVITTVPDFGLDVDPSTTLGAAPMQVTFDNLTPNATNYDFTWYFGDGNSVQDNAASVQHTYTIDGTWDVALVAEETTTGCVDSTVFNALLVTNSNIGLDELNLEYNVLLSPNPNDGPLKIEAIGFTGTLEVQVLNIEGQLMKQLSSSEATIHVDISEMASGIYLIEVSDESSRVVKRLIKK